MVHGIGDSGKFLYGGVELNKDEVKSYDCVADEKGKTRYVVTFNNGTTVSYKHSENAHIMSKNCKFPGGIYAEANGRKFNEQNLTSIYGVMGLEIRGTDKMDNIQISNSSIIKVDVSKDKKYDMVDVKNSKADRDKAMLDVLDDPYGYNSGWGDVDHDSKDKIYIDDNSTENSVHKWEW